MAALDPRAPRRRALDTQARHDRYRHLRENMVRHQSVSGFRTAKHFCEVCQTFEPDETGRCPLCAPAADRRSGNVVDDLGARQPGVLGEWSTEAEHGLGGLAPGEPRDGAA